MSVFRKIAVGYSTRCNIKCGHCVADGQAGHKAKMDLARAKEILQEMAFSHVKGISFTAGEPLLFIDDLMELIALCKQHSIYSRVVTNGFWAKTPRRAEEIISRLMSAGLSQLRISYSRWHQQHVSRNNVLAAATAAKKLGLDYFISFVTDFTEADEPYEHFLRDKRLRFFPEPLIYFGNAQNFDRPKVFTDYQTNRCEMNPYLSPQLDMFACCDAGSRFSTTDFLYLGNLKNDTVETLFQRYEQNKLYYWIKRAGLTPMASSLGFTAREIVTYRKCELCETLFNSKEKLNRLQQLLKTDLARWVR